VLPNYADKITSALHSLIAQNGEGTRLNAVKKLLDCLKVFLDHDSFVPPSMNNKQLYVFV